MIILKKISEVQKLFRNLSQKLANVEQNFFARVPEAAFNVSRKNVPESFPLKKSRKQDCVRTSIKFVWPLRKMILRSEFSKAQSVCPKEHSVERFSKNVSKSLFTFGGLRENFLASEQEIFVRVTENCCFCFKKNLLVSFLFETYHQFIEFLGLWGKKTRSLSKCFRLRSRNLIPRSLRKLLRRFFSKSSLRSWVFSSVG